MASDSRQSLLHALTPVFRDHGYAGASLSALAAAAGPGRATLYHHFPGGKDEMANAVIAQAMGELDRRAYRKLSSDGPWNTRIRKFISGFSRYVDHGSRNCVLAVFTSGTAPAPLVDQIHNQTRAWLVELTGVFVASGLSRKRARRSASELLGRLYGALALAQLRGQPKIYRRAIKRLLRQLSL